MVGGSGNDLYEVDNPQDVILELPNQGIDRVNSTISYSLTADVESLFLVGNGNLNGTGNSRSNFIQGNSSANTLIGNSGNDTLRGLNGNDFLDGSSSADTLNGGSGNDTLNGGVGVDSMVGGLVTISMK